MANVAPVSQSGTPFLSCLFSEQSSLLYIKTCLLQSFQKYSMSSIND